MLSLEYDAPTKTTYWRVDRTLIQEAKLPECMVGKELLFMLCLKHKGDQVEISVE